MSSTISAPRPVVPARPASLFARCRAALAAGLARLDARLRAGALPDHDARAGAGVCPYGRRAGEPCPDCEAERDSLNQW